MLLNPDEVLLQGPEHAPLLILAHGAGAGYQHEFFEQLVPLLIDEIAILRFHFPYMQLSLETGKRRPPDRLPKLIQSYKNIIPKWDGPVFIGGKSLGGRVATHVALELNTLQGVIVLGFPFHPIGKPDSFRGEHLAELSVPTLICQGERDNFGSFDEYRHLSLPSQVSIHWIRDGDHGFKPRKSSGLSWIDNLQYVADEIKRFIRCHIPRSGEY
ncbi:alpha/beta family hydrolase [Celerinatantimonas sp. YJH-8]|uniref:alpha/beta family hydrolase n=1 Tax=Celerinatantimonas sp. YJH-8 TaxID=3228714 RepID=UPI0038C1906E